MDDFGSQVSSPFLSNHESVPIEKDSSNSSDFASRYDFCIVFPSENGKFTDRGKGYMENLKRLGFEMYIYKGSREESHDIYVLLKVPLEYLRIFADRINFVMKLDEIELKKTLEQGDPTQNISGVTIPHHPEITPLKPYQFIYGKYSRNIDEAIYWKSYNEIHPFRESIKLKINGMILESRLPHGGENLKIRRYIKNGWLKGCFPLHNRTILSKTYRTWIKYPLESQPLDDIKEYFGEKIGLYFTFMDHYTLFLCVPAIIGIPLQITAFALNDYSGPYLPFYSFFMALWAVVMLEFWKRREKTTALHWGMINFEANEVDRPDFRGDYIESYVDGSKIRHFPSGQRNMFITHSALIIVVLVSLVLGVVVSIYIMRYAIATDVGSSNAQTLASVVNAIQIQVMNFVYTFIATALTERENHRTETQFEDSMIIKIFWFQFINSYASFFYLAFVAESFDECSEDSCIYLLAINLAIIFGIRLVTGNLLKLGVPYLMYQYRHNVDGKYSNQLISRPEEEFLLDPYDQLQTSLSDYAEIAIQFGYNALFVAALPLASVSSWVSNIVSVRGDAFKHNYFLQRPFPRSAEDIGTWQTIFLILSVAAVITNAGLAVFTMTTLDAYSTVVQFWIFILFQWVCFALQALIMVVIPDVPEEIDIQLKRTEFMVSKVIDKVSDDAMGDMNVNQTRTPTMNDEIDVFQPYPF